MKERKKVNEQDSPLSLSAEVPLSNAAPLCVKVKDKEKVIIRKLNDH